jgi:hypothetical protein
MVDCTSDICGPLLTVALHMLVTLSLWSVNIHAPTDGAIHIRLYIQNYNLKKITYQPSVRLLVDLYAKVKPAESVSV